MGTYTSLSSALGPTRSVVLNLCDKRVAEDNCGTGNICKRYVLEAISGATAYDFNVSQQAYEAVQANTCYQFTYYPEQGLLAEESASYQQIVNVARIQAADPSACG